MSAAVSKNGKQLFVGAPGSLYWQGQVFEHDLELMTSIQTKNKALSSEDDSFLGMFSFFNFYHWMKMTLDKQSIINIIYTILFFFH